MKQNHTRKHTPGKKLKSDDAVSSVVSEMLLLAIGVILVAVFAVTLVSLLPGDRDDHVDITVRADTSAGTYQFWHKGGDPISAAGLRALVYGLADPGTSRTLVPTVIDREGNSSRLFDIGGYCTIPLSEVANGDQVRLVTENTIIYSGVVKK